MKPDAAQLEKDQRCLNQADRPQPDDQALVDVCRLLLRYDGGAYQAIADHALAILEGWGLDRAAAFARCRTIWQQGFRPVLDSDPVGSGSDTNAT